MPAVEQRWCIRCGKRYDTPGAWCSVCHPLVVAEIHRREALPVGYGGQEEIDPVADVRHLRTPQPSQVRARPRFTQVCAHCGRLQEICGHILGRPWCWDCLSPRPVPGGREGPLEDGGPWQDIPVRALEDAPAALE